MSPPSRGSSLMTSAPKSASMVEQNGPARAWLRSSTLTSSSGMRIERPPGSSIARTILPDRPASVQQFAQPSLEEASLRPLSREGESPLVGGPGLGGSPEPPAQLRPRRVGQVIVGQLAAGEDRVDQ